VVEALPRRGDRWSEALPCAGSERTTGSVSGEVRSVPAGPSSVFSCDNHDEKIFLTPVVLVCGARSENNLSSWLGVKPRPMVPNVDRSSYCRCRCPHCGCPFVLLLLLSAPLAPLLVHPKKMMVCEHTELG
jgi:hypothetical protein